MPSPITTESVTRRMLPNGLTVLVMENHSTPVVVIRGRLLAGALRDTAKGAGQAMFTAAALHRGTDRYTFRELNELYDRYGLSFGVGAGLETASFGGKALIEDFDRLLKIGSEVLLRPAFPDKEIERLRTELIADLRESDDDTREVAYKEFRRLVYPAPHPYHRLPDGTEASLRALKREDLARFHERYYKPAGGIVVIVGDVRADEAIEKVQRYLGGWKGRAAQMPEIPSLPPRETSEARDIHLAGKSQADLVIGYPGLTRNDPEFYPLWVGDLIFGRMGLSGRIGANVRDKRGLAYYVFSSIEAGKGAGPWLVSAGVNPKNIAQARDAILDEIRELRRAGVKKEELSEAKDFLTGYQALRLETNEGLAGQLTEIEYYGLGLDYVERYPAIIRALTREQIHAAVQKYAQPDAAVTVIAGPPIA